MDPLTASLAAQGILALVKIYATHTGKPADWVPVGKDWDDLAAWARRTPADIKREALERAHLSAKPSTE